MLRVRTTKTGSGNTAVQVVYRHNQKTQIVKHIGTARDAEEEKQLRDLAGQYIATNKDMPPLLAEVFGLDNEKRHLVAVENLRFTKTYHHFAYEFLSRVYP